MMETPSSIIDLLRVVADSLLGLPNGMTLYLFGSTLSGATNCQDTDVLLVYSSGNLDAAHKLSTRLRSLAVLPPIEVVALSCDEEDETGFIESVGAQQFWTSNLVVAEENFDTGSCENRLGEFPS